MGKKRRKANPWIVKRQRQTLISKPAIGDITIAPDGIPKNMSPQEIMLTEKINIAVKSYIFPLRNLIDRRYRHVENLEANQIALQTILHKKGLIDGLEFENEYKKVVSESFGITDEVGNMMGHTAIDLYNIQIGENR